MAIAASVYAREEDVAKMSDHDIERTCDILHAEMLKASLTHAPIKSEADGDAL